MYYPELMTPEVLIIGTPPKYARPGDAGADLVAARGVTLAPGERATIPTGVSIALPDGFVGFVMPRSGLASKHGIGLVNSPGTIDAGYRGEISVVVINTDATTPFVIDEGDASLAGDEQLAADAERVAFVAGGGARRAAGGTGLGRVRSVGVS
jgi:dUTP pyrophosphatase